MGLDDAADAVSGLFEVLGYTGPRAMRLAYLVGGVLLANRPRIKEVVTDDEHGQG